MSRLGVRARRRRRGRRRALWNARPFVLPQTFFDAAGGWMLAVTEADRMYQRVLELMAVPVAEFNDAIMSSGESLRARMADLERRAGLLR